ncbi:MAG TPA: sugar-binding transcriptional regulator, partial [Casimicrobiaceae bacterium]
MPAPNPRTDPRDAQDMAVRAAWLYYVEGLTQEAIARAMNLSRTKVIRLLSAAREQGVVRIRIDAKGSEQLALERELIAAYGLDEVLVTPAPADEGAVAAVV